MRMLSMWLAIQPLNKIICEEVIAISQHQYASIMLNLMISIQQFGGLHVIIIVVCVCVCVFLQLVLSLDHLVQTHFHFFFLKLCMTHSLRRTE